MLGWNQVCKCSSHSANKTISIFVGQKSTADTQSFHKFCKFQLTKLQSANFKLSAADEKLSWRKTRVSEVREKFQDDILSQMQSATKMQNATFTLLELCQQATHELDPTNIFRNQPKFSKINWIYPAKSLCDTIQILSRKPATANSEYNISWGSFLAGERLKSLRIILSIVVDCKKELVVTNFFVSAKSKLANIVSLLRINFRWRQSLELQKVSVTKLFPFSPTLGKFSQIREFSLAQIFQFQTFTNFHSKNFLSELYGSWKLCDELELLRRRRREFETWTKSLGWSTIANS